MAGFEGEKITEGLDGLRERLAEYAELGAKFCKWRAVITIGDDIPSRACIDANAHALARYAALCQEAGLVPIVEPEVLMDGDHDLDTSYDVTEAALKSPVHSALRAERDARRLRAEGLDGHFRHATPKTAPGSRKWPKPPSIACSTPYPPPCRHRLPVRRAGRCRSHRSTSMP
jgi:hypothetical protein